MQKKRLIKAIKRTILTVSVFAVVMISYLSVSPIASAEASSFTSDAVKIRYGIPIKTPDSQTKSDTTQTVYYSYILEQQDYVNVSFPKYYNTNSELYYECAPVAGSMIVGYYDRYYSNLIPNFTPGLTSGNDYIYYSMSTYAQGIIDTLYVEMDTNDPDPGTTQTQYKNGLTSYIDTQGYDISYIDIASGGVINYNSGTSSLTYQISNGRPISLFLSGYNLCSITDYGYKIVINKQTYSDNHIMIAYGYKRIRYYNELDINFRTDLFLKVSSGIDVIKDWYFVGSTGTTINDAEAAYTY
jgi:hypothetical protein